MIKNNPVGERKLANRFAEFVNYIFVNIIWSYGLDSNR